MPRPKNDNLQDLLRRIPGEDYPKDLKEARRHNVIAEARRRKFDQKDDCSKKGAQAILLLITFTSLLAQYI